MPDRITLDDALISKTKPQNRITIDDALANYEASKYETRATGFPDSAYTQRTLSNPTGEPRLNPDGTRPGYMRVAPEGSILPPEKFAIGATLKSDIVEDTATKRKVIAESLFPNDPRGIDRVGFADGKPVYLDDQGQLRYVSGATTRTVSGVVASSPEIVGSTVGAFSGSPLAGGVLGGMGGRAIKRVVANLFLDEPQTVQGNAIDIATEGALNLATGGLAKLGTGFIDRGRIVDFTPQDIRAAEQVVFDTKLKTGIALDLAQASGDRKLIALRAYAARFPGKSADIIQAADEAASGQFEKATESALNLISKSTPAEVAGAQGRNAAKLLIEETRKGVYKKVEPLYEAAYSAVPEVKDQAILSYLELPHFKRAYRDGQRIAELEGNKVAQDAPPNLRSLDYTKRALDDRIEALKGAGNRQEARALQVKRDKFVAALDALPNQEWQKARKTYQTLAKTTIEPLENGPIGMLANIKDPKLATAGAKTLSDPNITPSTIVTTRSQMSKDYPDEWNGIVRQWLGQRFNQALKETTTGSTLNAPGKFRQSVYGTPRDKAKIRAMLPQQSVSAFEDLMAAAERLSSTPIAGSNTMRDIEIADQLKGTGAVVFRWLTSPRASILSAAEQRALEQGTLQIAEALVDPAKRNQLRQVTKMAPTAKQAILLASILTGKAAKESLSAEADDIPR